jgi:hypothetical protein
MSDSYHDILNDVLMNLSDNAYLRFEVPDAETGNCRPAPGCECGAPCDSNAEPHGAECGCSVL